MSCTTVNPRYLEEVTQPDQSKEDLKFLVEHFRCLSEGKESVIRQYRELLERYKPDFDAYNEKRRELYSCLHEISCLKKDIKNLREDYEKEKSRKIKKPRVANGKKKDSGRASQ